MIAWQERAQRDISCNVKKNVATISPLFKFTMFCFGDFRYDNEWAKSMARILKGLLASIQINWG